MPLSTRDLSELPGITELERLVQSLAMLDAIMSPEWSYRYFSYDPGWGAPADQRMASLDNGSGDGYFLVFDTTGAFLKGFDHESEMTPWAFDPLRVWDGVLDSVPGKFQQYLTEPAFDMESSTFCIWREYSDTTWQRGPVSFPQDSHDPDGSENLLWMLDRNPVTYVTFALDYYEQKIGESVVQQFYDFSPLTPQMVETLNPKLPWLDALNSASSILYPVAIP